MYSEKITEQLSMLDTPESTTLETARNATLLKILDLFPSAESLEFFLTAEHVVMLAVANVDDEIAVRTTVRSISSAISEEALEKTVVDPLLQLLYAPSETVTIH